MHWNRLVSTLLSFTTVATFSACGGSGSPENAQPGERTTVRHDGEHPLTETAARAACSPEEANRVKQALADAASVDPARVAAQKQPTIENIRVWLRMAEQRSLRLDDLLQAHSLECRTPLPKIAGEVTAASYLRKVSEILKHDVVYLKESYAGKL